MGCAEGEQEGSGSEETPVVQKFRVGQAQTCGTVSVSPQTGSVGEVWCVLPAKSW